MHHGARLLYFALLVRFMRPADGIRTVKRPRQCWVQVDDGCVNEVEKGGREDVHPSCQNNQIGLGLVHEASNLCVIVCPRCACILVQICLERACCTGDTKVCCARQAVCRGTRRNDMGDGTWDARG